MQSDKARIEALIEECKLAIDISLDMAWPQNVWTQKAMQNEIERLQNELLNLNRIQRTIA